MTAGLCDRSFWLHGLSSFCCKEVTLLMPLFVTQMKKRKQNICLYLMEPKRGFICSKQTCWKKALLILCFMDASVFFTASPVILSVDNPQEELIDPALKGTLNVLGSCAKTPSVKRVVITSSMAAVGMNRKDLADNVTIDESWFSDPGFCENNKLWYHLSKTLAEEAAWKFAKEKGIDIIKINPGWVIGPLLQPTLNSSVKLILKLVDGTETFPNITHRFVDVRDVANAHILAFENPSASGRYCLVGSVKHCSEIVKMLHNICPDLKLPDKCADDEPFTPTYQVSKERAESLGVKFTPLEVSLKDTVESLKHKNF